MWRENFINANPATIMQRLYQIKAEQDGRDVVVIAHAARRDELAAANTGEGTMSRDRAAIKKKVFMSGFMAQIEGKNIMELAKVP